MPNATAFGLDVASDRPLSFLSASTASPTGRSLQVLRDAEQPPWPDSARLLSDERHRDGRVSFQIEAAPPGYRFRGPGYGSTILSHDGRTAWGSADEGEGEGWQRLLVAQVLPFAAALRGLEPLHASGVVIGGRAVAISGPSGSGKTSLALAFERLGARMLADDVLAVERHGRDLLAHPGAPIAGLDRREAERLQARGIAAPGEVLAVDRRERVAAAALAREPTPLRSLVVLDRRPELRAPKIEPLRDPRELLACTFNVLLASSERLERLMDVCALLARSAVMRCSFGATIDADQLALRLWNRLAG